jgi:hypothetical protein
MRCSTAPGITSLALLYDNWHLMLVCANQAAFAAAPCYRYNPIMQANSTSNAAKSRRIRVLAWFATKAWPSRAGPTTPGHSAQGNYMVRCSHLCQTLRKCRQLLLSAKRPSCILLDCYLRSGHTSAPTDSMCMASRVSTGRTFDTTV